MLTKQKLENRQLALTYLETRLKLLKPENVLKRGYSITRFNGKALKDAEEVQAGGTLVTVLSRGKIESTITKTYEK